MTQVVEHLPSKCEALSSNHSTTPQKIILKMQASIQKINKTKKGHGSSGRAAQGLELKSHYYSPSPRHTQKKAGCL
jgi:hypothetical protein